jgi:hypothetical protein
MEVTFHNMGNVPWTGCLFLSFRDNAGNWQNVVQEGPLTLLESTYFKLVRPSRPIVTTTGTYILVPRYQTDCMGVPIELNTTTKFSVHGQNAINPLGEDFEVISIDDNKDNYDEVLIYKSKNSEQVIIVGDITKGAELIFQTGEQNGEKMEYKHESISDVYNATAQKYDNRSVIVTNGQFFHSKGTAALLGVNTFTELSFPVKIDGQLVSNKILKSDIEKAKSAKRPYLFFQKFGINNGRAFIDDFFSKEEIEKIKNEDYIMEASKLTSNNSLVGLFVTVADTEKEKTLLGVIDTDNNINNGYEKIAIYVGTRNALEGAKLLGQLGVPYYPEKENIGTKIVQLDGSASSQAYHSTGPLIINNESHLGYIRYGGNINRRIPHTLSILGAKSPKGGSMRKGADILLELEPSDQFIVYPNPSENGKVKMSFEGMSLVDELRISIFDEIGQQIGNTLSGKVSDITEQELALPILQISKTFLIHAVNMTTGKSYTNKIQVLGQE